MSSSSRMKDKTVVVTGSNTGIGKETALGLAQMGARVVMVCRDRHKGEAAQSEIKKRAGHQHVDLLVADLASLAAVRELAKRIERICERLDVLVNNAGLITRSREISKDGYELQLAVNHLAPFLLTQLLLPRLEQSAPSRIVVVASQVEERGVIRFDDLQGEGAYDPMVAYCQSKLANVMFSYALARRLKGTDVTVNCLHPGVIATQLLSDYMGRPRALGFVNSFKYPGPRKGALTSIKLSSDRELEKVSGCYFRCDTGETKSSNGSYDEELQERLWTVSGELAGIAPD